MPIKTCIIQINPEFLGPDKIGLISDVLENDGIMAYPTETFYGLGAHAFSEGAVKKIYRLKNREQRKPLSVVISDISMAEDISVSLPPLFLALARKFWPGPLTLVAKAKPLFPPLMLGPGGSLAMRVSDSPWLRQLIAHLGVPVTATSANISGREEISKPEEISRLFYGKIDLIVNGGLTPGGLPSTIVDLTSADPRILREGAVPISALQKFF